MNQSLPAPLDVKLMNLTASVLFLCCVLLLLAAGARWVLRYPGFSVARIVVQGELVHNNAVTLRANVAPQLAGNFFTIDLRAARAAFEQALNHARHAAWEAGNNWHEDVAVDEGLDASTRGLIAYCRRHGQL